MKKAKKSQANILAYGTAACLIILIACIRQPTLRSTFGIGKDSAIHRLVNTLSSHTNNHAQILWEFRDMYSRGIIYLAKYQSITVPNDLNYVFTLPKTFQPYLLYKSDKITSVEGSIALSDFAFLSQEDFRDLSWKLLTQTTTTQMILLENTNQILIIAIFDPLVASTANGYLYFDMRNDTYLKSIQDKKWLVVSLVSL